MSNILFVQLQNVLKDSMVSLAVQPAVNVRMMTFATT